MVWRVAEALLKLRAEVNEKWPQRSKSSDGTIGDENHASRSSDHNPWVKDSSTGKVTGIVTGMDITHDPAHGLDSQALADALIASRDARIKYIISNKKIASGTGQNKPVWKWRPYTGKNPHNHHVHISVKPGKSFYDSTATWALGDVVSPVIGHITDTERPVLKRGSNGPDVKELQNILGLVQDGSFGPVTETAVKAAQKAAGIVADGIVGPHTWDVLKQRS